MDQKKEFTLQKYASNKNKSNSASNVKRNVRLDSNGKYTDPVVESQYQT